MYVNTEKSSLSLLWNISQKIIKWLQENAFFYFLFETDFLIHANIPEQPIKTRLTSHEFWLVMCCQTCYILSSKRSYESARIILSIL